MTPARLVITIAQEEGSNGREIAKQLARTLQLNYVDEAVISLATENMSQVEIEHYIREIARQGQVVIVGCGANFILRDVEGVINILIRAPFCQRVQRLMACQHLDAATAEQRLYQLDGRYGSYIRQHFGPEWTNPDLYDLTINTKTLPVAYLATGLSRFVRTMPQNYQLDSDSYQPARALPLQPPDDFMESRFPRIATVLQK
jgi:cytidylate kinase